MTIKIFTFIILFMLCNRLFAQSWFFDPGMKGLEIKGIHYAGNDEEALGGELGYTWNSRFDFKIKYLLSEYSYEGQIMDGNHFIPQIEWYAFKYPSNWPLITSIFAAYHQESFTHQQLGTDYKLTGNGWSAGVKIFTDIFPEDDLHFLPTLEYRFQSIKRNLRRQPADQDLGTSSSHHFMLSVIMGKKFSNTLGIYMEPGIHFGPEQPVYQIKLGIILPFVEEDDE